MRRFWLDAGLIGLAIMTAGCDTALADDNTLTMGAIALKRTSKLHSGPHLIVHTFAPVSPTRPGLTLVFVEGSCTRCAAHVQVVKEFGESYAIYRQKTPTDAAVAVNGSFFGYDANGRHVPLGLVVAASVRSNRRIGWDRGGFLVHAANGATSIVPAKRYRQFRAETDVIQSKPLLVEYGRNGIRSDDGERFNRTAFAITTSGRLVIAGAFEGFGRAVSLHEFATFLLGARCADGSTIEWALSMDGGPGAQIYIPRLQMHFGDPGRNFVPNLVFIR